jgi:hypothetical protein
VLRHDEAVVIREEQICVIVGLWVIKVENTVEMVMMNGGLRAWARDRLRERDGCHINYELLLQEMQ